MRKKNALRAVALLLVLGSSPKSIALEHFDFYRGVRSLGMGGASIAVVNDESALIENPAALSKLRNFYGTVFDPEFETNGEGRKAILSLDYDPVLSTENMVTFLEENPDHYMYSRTQLFPSVVLRNFGIGLLRTSESYGYFDSTDSSLDLVSRTDLSFLMGYSFSFWSGRIKLGFNGKYIQRNIIDERGIDLGTTPDVFDLERKGSGVGLDTALMLTAPWRLFPTLALVARDIGGTKFDIAASDIPPETIEQKVDAGVSLTAIHSSHIRSQWAIEYRDILGADEGIALSDKLHGGIEINYGDIIFLRGGMYQQHYWTAGGEFSAQYFQIQVATYGVNVGTADSPNEDRRYVAKIAIRF